MVLWSVGPSGKCTKLHTVAASNNRYHPTRSLYYRLLMPHMYGCYSSPTSRSWWIAHSTSTETLQQHPLLTMNRTNHLFFCEGSTYRGLHILVTAPFCCNRYAWAARAQNFTLWQQATIEITRQDHSIIACLRHIYIGVIVCAHPVHCESHIQCNINWEVATMHFYVTRPGSSLFLLASSFARH